MATDLFNERARISVTELQDAMRLEWELTDREFNLILRLRVVTTSEKRPTT